MNQEEFEHCAYAGCERKTLKTSRDGYCIFHTKAEEKDLKEFDEALRDYIEEIKTKDLDYNFRGFIFVGDINFRKYFKLNVFRDIYFGATEFRGDVHFEGVKFQEDAHFREAEFHGDGGFQGAEFHGDAYFERVEFHGVVYFQRAEFQKAATFVDVGFYESAFFSGAEFQGRTWISPKLIKKSISFVLANLENVSLTPLNLNKNACIYFTRARLRNTEIRREDIENHIAQEKQKKLSEAKEVYLLLKNNFHSLGRYNDESWAFKKEKDMERKSYFQAHHRLKWFGSMFWHILYGYGERLKFILGWCAILIFFSSIWYWLYKGAGEAVGEQIVPLQGYLNYLYFSVVTFTTLGYGDFRPIGGCRVLASIEALLGIFFVALFIFTIARRTAGR